MPRSVPASRLTDRLMCASRDASPRASKSSAPHARAKKPRSSSNRSRSIAYAPATAVSVKIISGASHHAHVRDRHDEPAAAPPVLGLLLQNFVGEVPREQEDVRRLPLEQPLRRFDRQVDARHESPLLVRAAIDDEVEVLAADARVV